MKINNEQLILIEKLNSIKEKINSHLIKVINETITNHSLKSNQTLSKIEQFILKQRQIKSNQRGDITSSTLLKYIHDEDEEKLTVFQQDFLHNLNSSIEKYNLNQVIDNYNIKNLYVNVYLNDNCKAVVDELIKINNSTQGSNNKDIHVYDNSSNPINIQNTFVFKSIASFQSCFPEKFSIPRQGCVLSKTKGKIMIDYSVIDKLSLEGIEQYDYIWIIYVFHLHSDFKGSKVSPPKHDNKSKLGVYATRTPHRLNPIGLSLVKLDYIKNGDLYISGIDMVSGTPILDIKPYHHLESIEIEKYKYPNWIKSAFEDKLIRNKVEFDPKAELRLKEYVPLLEFYDSYDEIYSLIVELLEIDPHSKYTKRKCEVLLYAFYIDRLNVIYQFNALTKTVKVMDVEYVKEYKKIRNKDWLKEKSKEYGLIVNGDEEVGDDGLIVNDCN